MLALFIGQSALAYAAPCSVMHEDESGEGCPDEDDEGTCPCPIQCASCCAGSALRALPQTTPVLDLPPLAVIELLLFDVERTPQPSEPSEILHVPKAPSA